MNFHTQAVQHNYIYIPRRLKQMKLTAALTLYGALCAVTLCGCSPQSFKTLGIPGFGGTGSGGSSGQPAPAGSAPDAGRPSLSSSIETMPANVAIDVFSARGFLGGSEYERYALNGDVLWRECGSVSKTKSTQMPEDLEGSEMLKTDPNLKIEERRVESVTSEQSALLKKLTADLIVTATKSDRREPAPGSFFSLSDPGLFEMTIRVGDQEKTLLTSVDAVADKQTPALERAHELFAVLRGIGPTMCDAQTFFGIARLAPE